MFNPQKYHRYKQVTEFQPQMTPDSQTLPESLQSLFKEQLPPKKPHYSSVSWVCVLTKVLDFQTINTVQARENKS